MMITLLCCFDVSARSAAMLRHECRVPPRPRIYRCYAIILICRMLMRHCHMRHDVSRKMMLPYASAIYVASACQRAEQDSAMSDAGC